MKSIGELLKYARLEKKLTISDLEQVTKIKKNFLRAIENQSWSTLPEYPVVLGFVKSIAGVLDLEESKAVALLRRDYPPSHVSVNPKPDIPDKEFAWSPKLTFAAGILIVGLFIVGYLGLQYSRFVSPPKLEISEPVQDQQISQRNVLVKGITDPEATVKVNNQSAIVKSDGSFETEIEISKETTEINVQALSRSGKVTEVKRKIKPEI